jgi:hypothetical protein
VAVLHKTFFLTLLVVGGAALWHKRPVVQERVATLVSPYFVMCTDTDLSHSLWVGATGPSLARAAGCRHARLCRPHPSRKPSFRTLDVCHYINLETEGGQEV